MRHWNMRCRLWRRTAGCYDLSAKADACLGCGRPCGYGLFQAQELKEALSMKIVIVKSPKLFGGLLRRIFGIKKESYID